MEDALRSRLAEILGPEGVDSRSTVLTPADPSSLVAAVSACAEAAVAMQPCSGPATGQPGPGVTISLNRLAAVEVHAPSLTVLAEAGAAVAALRSAVQVAGLAFAAEIGTGSRGAGHVGTLISRGGVSRRALTGIEAVLTTGELVAAGGRMLKDVAPYDLAAALLGSQGRLAIIVSATFRLLPAGAEAPAHPSQGPIALTPLDELVRKAFDPQGLLTASR
jgi:glycolate oxidase FAD binding subunit